MPPAFNLSQDQTLQFNLCKLSSKLTWKNQFHVSIRVFLFARHHITYAMQHRPPTPNAHTYRLLIFKERAANTIRPLGLHADRKTVSFVASLCQQRRNGIMGIPRMDVNCFLSTEAPSTAKVDRSSYPYRPKIGSKSQSPRQNSHIVIICNHLASGALFPSSRAAGAGKQLSTQALRLSAQRFGYFSRIAATRHDHRMAAEHVL